MDSQDNQIYAQLLKNSVIDMQIITGDTDWFNVSTFEYTIFVPKIQRHYTGCKNLDEYDGVHQFDYCNYVGQGNTLKEAWDNFTRKAGELLAFINYDPTSETWQQSINKFIKEKLAEDVGFEPTVS